MNVLPQAPNKIEVKNQDLLGNAADREALSTEFTDSLKKGIEKEDAKKAANAAGAASSSQVMQNLPQSKSVLGGEQARASEELKTQGSKVSLKQDAEGKSLKGELSGLMSQAKSEAAPLSGKEQAIDLRQPVLDQAQAQGRTLAMASEKSQISPELKQSVEKFMERQNSLEQGGVKNAAQDAVPAAILQSMMGEGVDTSKLESLDRDFDVESLDVKDFPKGIAEGKSPAASSKLSTSDYLSLREISKKPDQQGLDLGTFGKPSLKKEKPLNPASLSSKEGAPIAAGMQQTFQLNAQHGRVVEAPTTQGTAGKTILSHDAVHQLTGQVNQLSQARQDGEIKIRLRPDHLGEIMMNVKTQGQQVAIQIKAHDGESKKIIEESLGALRDSLSRQNLSLSQVEVVTQPQASSGDQTAQMDTNGQRQNFGQDQSGGFNGEGRNQGGRQERLYEDSVAQGNLNRGRISRPIRTGGTQGLDLIA